MNKNYLENLKIEKFRGIKNLSLNNFNKINLILGQNNVGKTTVLECIRLIGSSDINYIYSVGSRNKTSIGGNLNNLIYLFPRNEKDLKIEYTIDNKHCFFSMNYDIRQVIFNSSLFFHGEEKPEERLKKSLINGLNVEDKIVDQISGKINDDGKITDYSALKLDFIIGTTGTKNRFNVRYLSPFIHFTPNDLLIGSAIKDPNYKKLMIDVLKIFDKNIVDIISAPVNEEFGEYEIFLVTGNKDATPLKFFGDGMKKFVGLASELIYAKDGILLIDEIETSLHHTMYEDIFYFLIKASNKFNIQLFITTHNKETVETLIELESKHFVGSMNVYTLNKKDNICYVKTNTATNIYELFLNNYIDVRN